MDTAPVTPEAVETEAPPQPALTPFPVLSSSTAAELPATWRQAVLDTLATSRQAVEAAAAPPAEAVNVRFAAWKAGRPGFVSTAEAAEARRHFAAEVGREQDAALDGAVRQLDAAVAAVEAAVVDAAQPPSLLRTLPAGANRTAALAAHSAVAQRVEAFVATHPPAVAQLAYFALLQAHEPEAAGHFERLFDLGLLPPGGASDAELTASQQLAAAVRAVKDARVPLAYPTTIAVLEAARERAAMWRDTLRLSRSGTLVQR